MSKEISIKKSNIILLILDYLQQEGYEKSYIDLEFESGVSLFDYPNEINFLKNLIINGQWNNVFDFLIPMEDLLGIENYKSCLFELKKLIFIETVERENSEVEQLVQMLNELQSLAPNEESFKELVLFLKNENEDLGENNMITCTRLECFRSIRNLLSTIFPSENERKIEEKTFVNLLNKIKDEELEKNKIFEKQNQIQYKEKKQSVYMINDLITKESNLQKNNVLTMSLMKREEKDDLGKNTLLRTGTTKIDIYDDDDKVFIMQKTQTFEGAGEDNEYDFNDRVVEDDDDYAKTETMNKSINLIKKKSENDEDLIKKFIEENQLIRSTTGIADVEENENANMEMMMEKTENFDQNYKEDDLIELERLNQMSQMNQETEKFGQSGHYNQSGQLGLGRFGSNLSQNDELEDLDKDEYYKTGYSYDYQIENFMAKIRINDVKPIRCGCFNPQGNFLTVGTNTSSVKIFDITSLTSKYDMINNYKYQQEKKPIKSEITQVREIEKHHNGSIYSIDWSCSGKLIATASNDQLVKCMLVPDLENLDDDSKLELTMVGHKGIVRAVCFDPTDELVLLSGGQKDKEIKIWDPEEGKVKALLEGHDSDVNMIKWSNDNQMVASSGDDRTVRFWDLRTCKCIKTISALYSDKINDISIYTKNKIVKFLLGL